MTQEQSDKPEQVTLADCPIGLFMSEHGELCLKTEYGDNEGRIDAYIVSSGEFFWGGAKTRLEQRKVLVRPVTVPEVLPETGALSELIGEARHHADMMEAQEVPPAVRYVLKDATRLLRGLADALAATPVSASAPEIGALPTIPTEDMLAAIHSYGGDESDDWRTSAAIKYANLLKAIPKTVSTRSLLTSEDYMLARKCMEGKTGVDFIEGFADFYKTFSAIQPITEEKKHG